MSISNITRPNNHQLYCAGLDVGSQKLENVAAPSVDTDGVNKAYVDATITASNDLNGVLTDGNDAGGLDMLNIGNITVNNDVNTNNVNATFGVNAANLDLDGEVIAGAAMFQAVRLVKDKAMVLDVGTTVNEDSPAITFHGVDGAGGDLYFYGGTECGNQKVPGWASEYSTKVGDSLDVKIPVTITSGLDYASGNNSGIKFERDATLIECDGNAGTQTGYIPAIGMYADQATGRRTIDMWTGSQAGNQRTVDWQTSTLSIRDAVTSSVPVIAPSTRLNWSTAPNTLPLSVRSTTVGSVAGGVFIEGGSKGDGTDPGFSAINYNTYINGGQIFGNVNKMGWRMWTDQRTTNDKWVMDTTRDASNPTGEVRQWMVADGITGRLAVNGIVGFDYLASPATRVIVPTLHNSTDIGASAVEFKDIYLVNPPIVSSDRNAKEEIAPLASDRGLSFVNALQPVQYKMKDGSSDRLHFGLIAQDVESLFSSLGDVDGKNNAVVCKGTGMIDDPAYVAPEPVEGEEPEPVPQVEVERYALRYNELISPLIKAVQELSSENQQLLTLHQSNLENVQRLTDMCSQLGSRVEALENALLNA